MTIVTTAEKMIKAHFDEKDYRLAALLLPLAQAANVKKMRARTDLDHMEAP
jgi:hypothetical protein